MAGQTGLGLHAVDQVSRNKERKYAIDHEKEGSYFFFFYKFPPQFLKLLMKKKLVHATHAAVQVKALKASEGRNEGRGPLYKNGLHLKSISHEESFLKLLNSFAHSLRIGMIGFVKCTWEVLRFLVLLCFNFFLKYNLMQDKSKRHMASESG